MLQQKHLYSPKSSLTFVYSRKHSQSFCLIPNASHFFLLSHPNLHFIVWILSVILLTRLDRACSKACAEICFFKKISSPFLSIFLTSFYIRTVKVMHFSVFSLKQVIWLLNSFSGSFMIKWQPKFHPLQKIVALSLGILHSKLHMLCSVSLC